jgi:hypothetical protein
VQHDRGENVVGKGGYSYFWIRVELFNYLLRFLHYQSRHGQRAFIFKRYCLPFLITIFCIQGAKAAQKRERNAEKQKGASKSQAKVNEAAKTIICSICKQDFVSFVYPSRCSTTDQSFSIVAYYPCACVSDLNYHSKPNSTTVPCISTVLRNMPQINTPRRWQIASLHTKTLKPNHLRRFRWDFYVIYVDVV